MMKPNSNLRIIVIDDNPAIHQDFLKILTTSKKQTRDTTINEIEHKLFGTEINNDLLPQFEIETASQGQEGVEKIKAAIAIGKPYALAFVDIRMPPGWDGIETIKHIWAVDNQIQVVICTAYSDYSWEETVAELGQTDNLLILKKPFDTTAVRQLACALTKKWQLLQEAKDYTVTLEDRVRERTKSLNKSLSLMRATLESSADGVLVVDQANHISDFNSKFIEMWHLNANDVKSKNLTSLINKLSTEKQFKSNFMHELHQILLKVEEVRIGNIEFNDDSIFEYYTQPYFLDEKIIGRVWSFRDISARVTLEKELKFNANHDALTRLPNRTSLLDSLAKAITNSINKQTHFAVFFLDLDRFKLINDSLSHEAGDEILKQVATRLRDVLKTKDKLARLGGDEFVVLIEGYKSIKTLSRIAHQILSVFHEPFNLNGFEVILTTSIGIATYPDNGSDINELLRNADTAMYAAKDLGANQYQLYTNELNVKNTERLEREAELHHAIERNEFVLMFQPQFDINSKKFVSVEALIRWQHPKKGLILPMQFIPLAEETGLIIPIGEWVLRTACKQIKAWHETGLCSVSVAVNVATKQVRSYNFVKIVADILKETGLNPNLLELELTENMLINNVDTIAKIHQLKALGVIISLDDFGTGCSSLNYLRQIPIDKIKIDQSYVKNIESKTGDEIIIQAIIAMAASLNLQVLAEGVETKSQFDFLKTNHCLEMQGFYFSKPLSAGECEKLFKEYEPVVK